MFEALLKSFPMAMGITLSPGPILAIVLLLMTNKAKINGPLFFLGWFIGIQIIASSILFMPGVIADHGGMSDHTGTTKIILGFILLVSIFPVYLKKKKEGGKAKIPTVFNKLDKFGPMKIFIIGFVFSAVSIKNIALSASGAAHIHTTSLIDYFETLLAVFYFSIMASLTIIIPILLYFASPEKSAIGLQKLRNWLIKHHWNLVMTMLLAAGVLLIGIGANIHMT
ncbi:MAG: GAP family protein [Urechidicola sp.]|nr:GAP family protein [Urechidicola sp.]